MQQLDTIQNHDLDHQSTLAISSCLEMLTHAYPYINNGNREQMSDETITLWIIALGDLDPKLLKMAVLDHITSNKWFPSIAEIRQNCAAIIANSKGRKDSTEAWGEVSGVIRKHGMGFLHHRIVNDELVKPKLPFDDITLQAIDSAGGWRNLCMSENPMSDRARFIQAYEQLAKREDYDVLSLRDVREYTGELSAVNQQMNQLASGLSVGSKLERVPA